MTSVPDTVDVLVAFAGTVFAPELVFDGPPSSAWPDQDAIAVGWAGDGPGISIEQVAAGFVSTDQETVNVSCVIRTVGGDLDIKPIRARAFAYYNTLAIKMRQDKTLGGAVANARLSAASATQFLDETAGGSVLLAFTITCTAFI